MVHIYIILSFLNSSCSNQRLTTYCIWTFSEFWTVSKANRIANGSFVLDGTSYHTCQNNGPNTLHGGKVGWSTFNNVFRFPIFSWKLRRRNIISTYIVLFKQFNFHTYSTYIYVPVSTDCMIVSFYILDWTLHSPLAIGFDRRVWQVAEGWNQFPPNSDEISITFTYVSEDGEENFPGELHVCVIVSVIPLYIRMCYMSIWIYVRKTVPIF